MREGGVVCLRYQPDVADLICATHRFALMRKVSRGELDGGFNLRANVTLLDGTVDNIELPQYTWHREGQHLERL